ncbi:caspase family protein, partial [Nocardia sp. NPDC050789]|uniref:caspase, EACC1-associated type n=1 Tax=Nocardia sp. NPDC050789 TaxID=3154841 RepID=UPI0033C5D096
MTEGQVPQDSRAILIGTSRYEHDGLDPIPAVVANVNDLAEVLTGSGGAFTTEHCISIIDPSRTADVGHAVGRAAQEATGVLLVYYTGHGLLDRKGRLHLTLTGSAPDRIRWTTVPFETLREEILDSPARVRILILDCCFAGRAFEAMTDLPGLVAGQTELRGTYTIASSAANEPSFAPTGHRNTAFTGALLNAAAAAPGSTLNDLYHEAEQHLRRDGHPRPQSRSIDVAGEVRLFGELGPEHRFLRAAEAGEPVAMTNLGQLLEQRGQLDEAEAWYRRAADAGEPVAMTNLGQLLEQHGKMSEAGPW